MLVIFDFDGTLADTWELLAEDLVAGAEPLRYRRVDRRQVEALRRLDTRQVFRTLGVRWWRLPRVVAHLRRRAAARADEIALFPGMRDVVVALAAAGHALAVVSSNSENTVRTALGPDLAARFGLYGCSASLFGKAARFRRLCRRSGAAPAIAIGDETRDLDAAAAAKIAALAVEWGYADAALLRARAPGRTVASPDELLARLLRFAREGRLVPDEG